MSLEDVRRRFADELVERRGIRSAALRDAFARVPRERFLGPGPWLVFLPDGYTTTPGADPELVYDAERSLAIDSSRFINNAAPILGARMLDELRVAEGSRVLHVGCGAGYYTAILAELVGPAGRVVAVELEPEIARQAQRNVKRLRQVEVVHGDGLEHPETPCDGILVSAGVSHPQPAWLDGLTPGGRLVLPITGVRIPGVTSRVVRDHAGLVLRVQRTESGYPARFVDTAAVPPLFGGRDPEMVSLFAAAIAGDDAREVRSLRRDSHEPEPGCWVHGAGICLSRQEA